MLRKVIGLTILLSITLEVAAFDDDPIAAEPLALQPCPTTGRKMICKDCHTLQMCNDGSFSYEISCAAQYPGRPYCYTDNDSKNNTCVSTPTPCQWTEFNCPSVGLYPNLEDCKSYYACSKAGSEGAKLRYCLYNSVYNVEERMCKTNAPCYSPIADCAGQSKIIPYKPSRNYYVICQGTNIPTLEKCPRSYVFNINNLECEFQCSAEGVFPNIEDKKKFISCYYNGRTYVRVDEECGTNEIFDPDKRMCVSENLPTPNNI